MHLSKFLSVIFIALLFGSNVESDDSKVVISFPTTLDLSLPVKNNGKYTVHLTRQKSDGVDGADVVEDADGTQWHMNKLELVKIYENTKESAVFTVAKIIENGILKTKYVGDFVYGRDSYSMFPNTAGHKMNKEETSVLLDGVEYVIAIMKSIPPEFNGSDRELKPPKNTVFLNGHDLSSVQTSGINRAKRYSGGVVDLVVEALFILDYSIFRE
ncbi:hypothetical protein HELRODRAFT_172676 [Helobdella robusta]|uniref:Uncharacterized protein n=1 Tax=Helobdella robusta TaxID=6412 RepID=T1F5R9_HELRO|nr:hypothetical protein HELRODRAFT_172676 [Helobdella robusta]ESO04316.1 hypothetical protein HELRODRAFT_172676 [Helobdella robusta]